MNYKKFILFLKQYFIEKEISDSITQRNIITEEFQKLLLGEKYTSHIAKDLYFLGGTNLRISYGLARFSEDLDFEYYGGVFNTQRVVQEISGKFLKGGFPISSKKWNLNTHVYKTFFHLENILYDLGSSPLKSEKISVKLEIDVMPSNGAIFSKKLIQTFTGIAIFIY